ncbi:hypothetical protein BC831DRAFT_499737 [Entophlyctis helioformis]|nr:hypothetical protein BC831DRAFT_499737 [Entophlyctis helioformis]
MIPDFPTQAIPLVSTYAASKEQEGEKLPLLFTPLTIRGVTFKNRVAVSPMCTYSSENGFFNMWHASHLSQYAVRGAGLIIIEATGVQPNGRISTHCSGIWSDDHIPALKQIAAFCQSQGAKIGIQLAHAGRKAGYYSPHIPKSERLHDTIAPEEHGGWPKNIIAPSAIRAWPSDGEPREATLEDIAETVAAFGAAARRANEAGLDVIELHGAHGYLINEFLSPISNKRTDHYGGSFENRIRFLVEVCKEARKFWPEEKPMFVRLSCSDWIEGGWTSDDTVALSKILVEHGVDLIDCSSGGIAPQSSIMAVHPYNEGWNVHFAEAVKQQVPGMLSGAVGGITDPHFAEALLQDGKADLILMAREFLRNPTWVASAGEALGVALDLPVQLRRSVKPKPAAKI